MVTDLFSRWVEAFPLGSATAGKIVLTLENNVFNCRGYLPSILSDNGPQFRSQQWDQAGRKCDIELYILTHHPRANLTERRNWVIKTGLRLCLKDMSHRHWDKKIPEILFNLRSRKNVVTSLTPSPVLFGKTLKRPGEWKFVPPGAQERTSPRVEQVQQHQAEYLCKTTGHFKQSHTSFVSALFRLRLGFASAMLRLRFGYDLLRALSLDA